MNRELSAVLMTYATRRSFQWLVGVGVVAYIVLLPLLAIDPRPDPTHRAHSAFMMLGFPAAFVAFMLVSQAKWQFVDPRARLLPRFTAFHVSLLLIIAIVGLLALPCAVGLAARLNVLGLAACSIAVAVCIIWATHNNQAIWILLGLVIFYSLMSGPGMAFWLLPEEAARFRMYHVAILVGCWAAYGAWLVRLSRLDEEADDYNIPVQAQTGSATRMERTQANRNVGRQLLRSSFWRKPADLWHDRLTGRHEVTTAGRQRLFRYGFAPLPAELTGLWIGVIMFFVGTFPFWGIIPDAQGRPAMHGAFAPFLIMPSMFPGQFLAVRRARLSSELMLPLTRTEFIDGILKALARNAVFTFVILACIAVVILALIASGYSAAEVAGFAVVAVAVQPYMFGMSVRMALYPSAILRIVLVMVELAPALAVAMLGFWLVTLGQWSLTMLLATVSAALGAWIIARARRAWLNAELA